MKSLTILAATILAFAATAAPAELSKQQIVAPAFMKAAGSRTFAIEYVGTVTGVPAGAKKLRLWLPVPQDSTVQRIRDLTFSKPPQIATELKYGDKIAYWEIDTPKSTHEVTMRFTCERKEIVMDLARLETDDHTSPGVSPVFLKPDKLVLVDDEIRKIAEKVTTGKGTTLEKAHAIYDYVLEKMAWWDSSVR